MSLIKLIEQAGVSLESIDTPVTPVIIEEMPSSVHVDQPLVEGTVVSPVDAPSATVPVNNVVISTEPVVTEAVTVPPVDVVPVTELETVVSEAVVATQIEANAQILEEAQCAIQEKADELLEIQTALESMDKMIRSHGAKGISNATAEAVQGHLKTINRQLGIKTDFISIESFVAKDIREEHAQSTIALESIRTSVKVAKNKFIKVIEKIIAFFKKVVMNHVDGINHLEREAIKLDSELSKVKVVGGNGKMVLANAGKLYLNGEVVQGVTADIKGLAHFTSVAYPKAIVNFLDGIVKGVLKFDPEGAGMDEVEAFFEKYSKPLAYVIEQKIDEELLPGEWAIDVPEHGLTIGLKRSKTSDVGEMEIPVLPTVELRKIIREIINVLTQMKNIRPEVDKINKASERLIESVKRAIDKKGSVDNEKAYAEMTDRVARIVMDSTPRIGDIIGYLVNYLRAQLIIARTQMAINAKENAESE